MVVPLSWRWRLGNLFLACASVCALATACTVWWACLSVDDDRIHLGLWRVCRANVCVSVYEDHSNILLIIGRSWMVGVQWCICAGISSLLLGCLMVGCYQMKYRSEGQHGFIHLSSVIITIAGLFLSVAVVTYAMECSTHFNAHISNGRLSFGHSFYGTIASVIAALSSAILFYLEYINVTSMKIHYVTLA